VALVPVGALHLLLDGLEPLLADEKAVGASRTAGCSSAEATETSSGKGGGEDEEATAMRDEDDDEDDDDAEDEDDDEGADTNEEA